MNIFDIFGLYALLNRISQLLLFKKKKKAKKYLFLFSFLQSLQPPGKESVSSAGRVSSVSGAGGAGAPRKVLKGKPKPLYFWTSADVNKWWRKHGGLCYQLYGDLLTEHDVGGEYTMISAASCFGIC